MLYKGPYKLKPSLYLATVLSVLHAAAVLVVWASTMPWWLASLLSLLCWLSLQYHLHRYVYLDMALAVTTFSYAAQGNWLIEQHNGERYIATLLPDSVVTAEVLWLHFRCLHTGWRYKVPLFSDSLAEPLHRRLRVLLGSLHSINEIHGLG